MAEIPALSREDVLTALGLITRNGVPRSRRATKFELVHEGRRYPPKYVISIACQVSTGRELRPSEFSGGVQSNTLLRKLGFEIETKAKAQPRRRPVAPNELRTAAPREFSPVARVLLDDWSCVDPIDGEEYLMSALGGLEDNGMSAKFLLTPGGFVHAPLPEGGTGASGWESTKQELSPFVDAARVALLDTVTDEVLRRARGKVEVITVGVDVIGDAAEAGPHAELVAVIDVESGKVVRWTGKSYPTASQENTLVHVVDLASHCVELGGERVLVLGCHDLNVFNPRGRANQSDDGYRRRRCEAFEKVVKDFRPSVVLQHPHTTDSPNIWRNAWARLLQEVPSVRTWASGIRYYNPNGVERGDPQDVLDATASNDPPPWNILALLD